MQTTSRLRTGGVLTALLLSCCASVIRAQDDTDSLRRVLAASAPDTTRVNTLNTLAQAYMDVEPDSSISYASQAQRLAEELAFEPGLGEALRIVGTGHMRRQEYGIASSHLQRALALCAKLGDAEKQKKIHFALAHIAEQQSDFPEALKQHLISLKLAEQLGDSAAVVDGRMDIGVVYGHMGEHAKATALLEQVLQAYERTGDSLSIARTCNNLGNVLDDEGRSDEARTYLNRAVALARTLGHPMGEAITLGSLANHYQRLEQFDTALVYNERILALLERIGDPFRLAAASINAGEILTRMKRYDEAEEYLNRGIGYARSVGAKQWLSNAHAGLYDIANAQGEAAKALEQFKLHIAYQDSITNEANTRKAVQVQMQYDFDKKEAATRAEQEKKDALSAEELRRKGLQRNALLGFAVFGIVFAVVDMRRRRRIKQEHARSEALLLNILPEEVAEELKAKGSAEAVHIDQVTVLFTDFKGFTAMSETLSPQELVRDLNECFSAFDHITAKYGIEKIKTIGDAYMAAGGLPTPNTTHATDVIKAAFEMRDFIAVGKARKIAAGLPYFEIRIGIHTGPVVAGIVGVKKFSYDIWGDTVNTASRMESSGEVGQVNISEATYAFVKSEPGLTFTPRGKVQAKGKGEMEMYFVERASSVPAQ
ncbi:MAG: tetratricopeptide repeat protein [Flavobacteriales bacterium]|nr:tetratricopeptide repeat protein [Flavobacteriales bacterium]